MTHPRDFRTVRPEDLSGPERYGLVTSLVVPRPIGWISTASASGAPNLAPYSFFAALSANPILVGASIGHRKGVPKDTLANIRETGAFCVNVCSDDLLEAMNQSSSEVGPEVDEFRLAALTARPGVAVEAPWVEEAPAVLECSLFKEVTLGEAPNIFVIGRVEAIHLSGNLSLFDGSWDVDPMTLRPVGRLGRDRYAMPGEVSVLPRPSRSG